MFHVWNKLQRISILTTHRTSQTMINTECGIALANPHPYFGRATAKKTGDRSGGILVKFAFGRIAVLGALAFLCAGLTAFGQNTSVTLTGVNGSTSAGDLCSTASGCEDVYTGLYYATVGGATNSPIICDDFNHNVTIGENWSATAINTSALNITNITGLEFGGGANGQGVAQVYAEVADLVSEIFSLNNGSGSFGGRTDVTGTDLSEAIWYITTPGHITGTGLSANAVALVAYVEGMFGGDTTQQALNYLHTLSLWILTPSPNNGPQEMWALNVAEGGAALLYLLLAGLFCSFAIFKRKRERASISSC
jgi:hypothetical protein